MDSKQSGGAAFIAVCFMEGLLHCGAGQSGKGMDILLHGAGEDDGRGSRVLSRKLRLRFCGKIVLGTTAGKKGGKEEYLPDQCAVSPHRRCLKNLFQFRDISRPGMIQKAAQHTVGNTVKISSCFSGKIPDFFTCEKNQPVLHCVTGQRRLW